MLPSTIHDTANSSRNEHSAWRWAILVTQLSLYPGLWVMRLLILRGGLRRPANIHATLEPNVIYANHRSMLDPLLMVVSLPARSIFQLIPYRFLVLNRYFDNAWLRILLRLCGGFPAQKHISLPYGLEHSKRLLIAGQTIVIFPQGGRSPELVARPGIAALAVEPGVHLLPMHLAWQSRFSCRLTIGEPFVCTQAATPDELMSRVFSLASNDIQATQRLQV
ncbi:MAG: 1-acyl-sn-glycerol-3-phosphate acyltransferase [Patescibacteria group bacterium]|nr:1-acyl-sn-glycerol-3-phosphate acyltransferase [Patescibacteria group bacterium]